MKYRPEGFSEPIYVDHVDTIKGFYIIEYFKDGELVRDCVDPEECLTKPDKKVK